MSIIHKTKLYNILLILSRDIFFYKKVGLLDTFETRIYLMFFHFSILMIVFKKKGSKFDQKSYDNFFNNIEYNLRELGFGDVTVNKKMKEFNKILYDILLKLDNDKKNNKTIKISHALVCKYFDGLNDIKSAKFILFEEYFSNFIHFCFELPLDNMIEELNNFKT
jgi:cytochrome b pre-mRNA-processing protein 3